MPAHKRCRIAPVKSGLYFCIVAFVVEEDLLGYFSGFDVPVFLEGGLLLVISISASLVMKESSYKVGMQVLDGVGRISRQRVETFLSAARIG